MWKLNFFSLSVGVFFVLLFDIDEGSLLSEGEGVSCWEEPGADFWGDDVGVVSEAVKEGSWEEKRLGSGSWVEAQIDSWEEGISIIGEREFMEL